MNVNVMDVQKITMKAKRLRSDGRHIITIYIETETMIHEIDCFAGDDVRTIDWGYENGARWIANE